LQVSVKTSDQWHTAGFGTWPVGVFLKYSLTIWILLLQVLSQFADDTKLLAKVNNETDKEIIQKDLHQLMEF